MNNILITEEEKSNYLTVFESLTAQDRRPVDQRQLMESSAAQFLMAQNLPQDVLSEIWELVTEGKSFLTFGTFCKAMKLVNGYKPNRPLSQQLQEPEYTMDSPERKSWPQLLSVKIEEVPAPERTISTEVEFTRKVQVSAPKSISTSYWSSYYIYPIRTMFDTQTYDVNRRFKDLDWLHTKLTADYKGHLIPPLPDKPLWGNKNPAFVEKRRQEIESYLNLLLKSPEISKSPVLEMFLARPDGDFEIGKNSFDQGYSFTIPSAESIFDDTYAYIQAKYNSYGKVKSAEILEIANNLDALRGPLKTLTDSVSAWINAQNSTQVASMNVQINESEDMGNIQAVQTQLKEIWYMVESLNNAVLAWQTMLNDHEKLVSLLQINQRKPNNGAYKSKIDAILQDIQNSENDISRVEGRIKAESIELHQKKSMAWESVLQNMIDVNVIYSNKINP